MVMLRKGAEEARATLPELLDAAEDGKTTIVTRRGKPVAAITPARAALRQKPFPDDLIGSGRGYWGDDSTRTIDAMRDEWEP